MNLSRRLADLIVPVAGICLPLAIGVAFWMLRTASNLPTGPVVTRLPNNGERTFTFGVDGVLDPALAAVLRATESSVAVGSSGPLAQRFRLVGAGASGEAGAGGGEVWTVILEDRDTYQQRMVRPGDWLLPDVEVLQTGPSSVRVRTTSGEQSIGRLAEDESNLTGSAGKSGAATGPGKFSHAGTAFGGRQVAPNRWEFSRPALMDYYRELANEPERLLAVFDSLQPLYGNENKIEGYRLQVAGEADFFNAVGLTQGDVVRSVNSVPMTNRRRAEHFIRRVVEAELDTIILQVERDGVTVQQIYRTIP